MDLSKVMPRLSPRQRSVLVWFGVAVLVAVLQGVVFSGLFRVQPSCDDLNDGGVLCEYVRGVQQGVGHLFTESAHPVNYRPLQSLFAWASGVLFQPDPLRGIHWLHFVSAWFYLLVGMLWARKAGLGLVGLFVTGLVVAIHPVLGIMIASVDGFSSLLAPALAWLACAAVWERRDARSLCFAGACLLLGFGVKEYALSGVVLIPWAVFCREREKKWARAVRAGLLTGSLLVVWMLIRSLTIAANGTQTFERISLSPVTIGRNLAQFVGSLLFWGNTVTFFTERTPSQWFLFLAGALATLSLIGFHWSRQKFTGWRSPPMSLFLTGACFLASLPLVLGDHVSEMYVANMLLPLAVLVGLACQDLWREQRTRWIAGLVVGGMVLCGWRVGHDKTADLIRMGERTRLQVIQCVEEMDRAPDARRVRLLFREEQLRRQKIYSVFRIRDDALIGSYALNWYAPQHRRKVPISLGVLRVGSPVPVASGPEERILIWDVPSATCTRLDGTGGTATSPRPL